MLRNILQLDCLIAVVGLIGFLFSVLRFWLFVELIVSSQQQIFINRLVTYEKNRDNFRYAFMLG